MNELLVVCDILRIDHLGCYGYFGKLVPKTRAFAYDAIGTEGKRPIGFPPDPTT